MSASCIETDFLVVGTGPAGASAACFLGQNGVKGIAITSTSGVADTPRAHVFNPFALECLRDIGLEAEALGHATRGSDVQAFRWSRTMGGQEFGRVLAWGGHPDTIRDTLTATPCEWLDLPQWMVEPLLVKYATHHGFEVRCNTQLVALERQGDTYLCTVRDRVAKLEYLIRARYLLGADGSRSTVGRLLGFKFDSQPSLGINCNVLVNADMTHLMRGRESQITIIVQPESKSRFGIPVARVVRPWTQWLFALTPPVDPESKDNPFRDLTPEDPDLLELIKSVIGDDSVDVEVVRLDPWVARESVADTYVHEGMVFLLGDAAHQHTPAYGLGSNTCIQDAYNLAWKLAYVAKGLAGPQLLESYDAERQPVGAELVRQSADCFMDHFKIFTALGLLAPTGEEGKKQHDELYDDTEAGDARRALLNEALEGKRREGESIGMTMNQWYTSTAVYLKDEVGPRPKLEGDKAVKMLISTYPGNRLPHAWLDIATRRRLISTQDLAGHGSFCLLIGRGGEAWREAAANISKATGIPIRCYGIGFGLDYHDVYRDWHRRREVEESGCVLVRPDRFVAWRSVKMAPDCEHKLLEVFDHVLSRDGLKSVTTRL